MEEIFKPVAGFEESYEVSNKGRVFSIRRNNFLKGKVDKDGYLEFVLSDGANRKYKRGHRLVAEAFIPNPDNLPVINHIDHSKDNNVVENLEWCTVTHNTKYYYSGPNYKDGEHRMLSSLSNSELCEMVRLYCEEQYTYEMLYNHFGLKCRRDALGEILSGRRFSEITGITSDIRRKYDHPSVQVHTTTLYSILEDYYLHSFTRQQIKAKYQVTDKWMSVVFSGKSRKEEVRTFMEQNNLNFEELYA